MSCKYYEGKVIALGEICMGLRNSIEKVSREKDIAEARGHNMILLEERVQELQCSNRYLEAKLMSCAQKSTCHAPNADGTEIELMHSNVELKSRCEHLQKALEINTAMLERAKSEIVALQDVKKELEGHLEICRTHLLDMETTKSILEDKIRLYSNEDNVELTADLEKSLIVIKHCKRSTSDKDSSACIPDDVEDSKDTRGTCPVNLQLMQEVEKYKGMWEVEADINKNLKNEISSVISSKESEKYLQRQHRYIE